MRPRGKFVPFSEMAAKWCYPEDELIQLALQQKELNLYCLKPIPGNPARMSFFIGDELIDFLPGKTSISCSQFGFKKSDYEEGTFVPIGPENRKIGAIYGADNTELNKEMVTVYRSDLYLHQDEIAIMEKNYPELAGVSAQNDIDPNSQRAKSTEQSDARKETSGIRIIDEPVDILLSQDNSESASPSCADSKMVATLDSRLFLPEEIDKEGDLIDQAEKPDGIKQPHKKRAKSNRLAVDGIAELPLVNKEDKDPLPLPMRQAVQDESYLRLWDIIGDKKKGIQGIIPMSRTKWYDGIKAGIFPKQFRLGQRSVAWKKSDIFALLERMEKGELVVGPVAEVMNNNEGIC